MRFFFDRCCPPKLVDVIGAYEDVHSVRHFRDDNRFVEDTADVDWIEFWRRTPQRGSWSAWTLKF
jgi:hypothetical protein